MSKLLTVSPEVISRVFLVGCARSGTTLLQSMLMSHTRIHSFPETHFFERGFYGKRAFFLRGHYAMNVLKKWSDDSVGLGYEIPTIKGVWRRKKATSNFIRLLDMITVQQGKDIWIEKTPGHINHIDIISSWVKNVKFIHIIRDGRAVVASMYEAAQKYPHHWGGQRSINHCVAEWNSAILLTESYFSFSNHLVLSYESLLSHPELQLMRICTFLAVDYESTMYTNFTSKAQKIVKKQERWKKNNLHKLNNHGLKKYYQLFDENERLLIEQSLLLFKYYNLRGLSK